MQVHFQEVLRKPLEVFSQAPVVLIPALVAGIVNLAIGFVTLRSLGAFVVSVFGAFVTFFCLAWGTLLLAKYLQGERPNLVESWQVVSERTPNIVVAAVIVAVLVNLGALLFVVPGILLEVILITSIPHAARENVGFDKALLYALRFAFEGTHFLTLLLFVVIAFGLAFIPYVGEVLSAIFLVTWVSHFYLTRSQEFVDRPS